MGRPVQIDRAKHVVDVLEHVSKGVHTEFGSISAHVIDLGTRPWTGGYVASALQVHVVPPSDEEE